MSFTLDTSDVQRLEGDIKLFAARAYPYAVRQTLTSGAFRARQHWQQVIGERLVERNQYTRRSIRVEKARSLRPESMEAVVGSIADYMATTEHGGVERGSSGGARSIPTGYSAGQRGKRPRTRLPRRPHRMRNITLSRDRTQYQSDRQEIFVKVLMAARNGDRHIYLDTGEKKAIYEITGTGRLNSRGQITGVRMNMVQDLSHRSVRISPTPTLQIALRRTEGQMPEIYRRALVDQLRRNRVFGY